MTDDHSSSTRRNVLRTTGIVSLGAIGLTGAASAHSGEKKDDKKKHGKKKDEKKHDKKKDEKKHDKKDGKKHDKKDDKKKHGKKKDEKKHDKKHDKKHERHKQNGIVVELGDMRIRIGDHGISVKTSNGTAGM